MASSPFQSEGDEGGLIKCPLWFCKCYFQMQLLIFMGFDSHRNWRFQNNNKSSMERAIAWCQIIDQSIKQVCDVNIFFCQAPTVSSRSIVNFGAYFLLVLVLSGRNWMSRFPGSWFIEYRYIFADMRNINLLWGILISISFSGESLNSNCSDVVWDELWGNVLLLDLHACWCHFDFRDGTWEWRHISGKES